MKILFYLYASKKVTKPITLNQFILTKFIHAFILPNFGMILLSLHYLKYTIKYRIRQKSIDRIFLAQLLLVFDLNILVLL